nr:DUF397 domain-containing protein [Glycomyces harbinensis]
MTGYGSWRKSTRSGGGDNSSCVECRVTWRKSTRSNGGDDSSCVEARQLTGAFQVRDSKLGHDSPIFDLASTDFKALLSAAELDPEQLQRPPSQPRNGGLRISPATGDPRRGGPDDFNRRRRRRAPRSPGAGRRRCARRESGRRSNKHRGRKLQVPSPRRRQSRSTFQTFSFAKVCSMCARTWR